METADDIQAVVDELADRLGQSVLIEDRHQLPVWWSTRGAVDPARTKTIVNRRVDAVAAQVVLRYRLRQALDPVRVPAIPEAEMWARWCMPVRAEGRFLGLLWVLDPEGTVTESDLADAVACAEAAGRVMAGAEASWHEAERLRRLYLDQLLTGPDLEAARALITLERLAVDSRVQVDPGPAQTGWRLPDGLRVTVAGPRPRPALSGAPLPLVDLREAVRRARAVARAVAAGAVIDPVSWDGLGAWRLIVEAPETLTPDDLHQGATQLAALPQPDLLITARTVLDSGGDVAGSAEVLHLHRTTLYYRLDRIAALTGVDLRSGPGRTDLQLALWLAAYRSTHVESAPPSFHSTQQRRRGTST
jgi:hypothetical protein